MTQVANMEFSLNILLAHTKKLTALVIQETEYLRQMKISEIAKLQEEKNTIAMVLEKQQKQLRDNQEVRNNLREEDKLSLKEAAIEFDAAIGEYQEELFKAQKINELVIGKVIEGIKEHLSRHFSYNKAGTKLAGGTEFAKNAPAIKFNAQV